MLPKFINNTRQNISSAPVFFFFFNFNFTRIIYMDIRKEIIFNNQYNRET